MKKTILALLLCIIGVTAGATQQINDKVTVNGEEWEITTSPLDYLQPQAMDAFKALLGERDFMSTANQRGYVAYWYVERGRLYLDRVEVAQKNGEYKALDSKELKKVFRKYRSFGKIKAGWITGNLRVGYGIGERSISAPYLPAFEKEEFWVLRKGKIAAKATK